VLEATDFAPFRELAWVPWAMTAHVVYSAIDPEQPATLSPLVIRDIIRGSIGFDGFLVSDDLGMGALSGTIGERVAGALAAGCDVALHCNGTLDEMRDAAVAARPMTEAAAARLARGESRRLAARRDFDRAAAEARFDRLIAEASP
jgi:beta-N-acetylhexosaminidase